MCKRLLLIPVIVLLTGCGQDPTTPATNAVDESPRVQVGIGGFDESRGCLPFAITAVHEEHQPSTDPPFYVGGGEWTFFDCQSKSDRNTIFTIGAYVKSSGDGDSPFGWGRAVLIVKDREAGGRFVELFAKSFPGMMPNTVEQPHVPEPLFLNTAILGDDLNREATGGFSGSGGGWTATKWFLELDGYYGEVFFNYNLAERQAEFSEKDAEYADDLLAILASALRDGPRPERTPENDPNLSPTGPNLGSARRLVPRTVTHYAFSPKGGFAVFQDGPAVSAFPIDEPDGSVFEVVRFEHSLGEIFVLNENLDLLVQERIPDRPGVRSSADSIQIWFFDRKTSDKTLLRGPEKLLDLAESPISPDNRYAALSQWTNDPGTSERTKVLHLHELEGGKAKTLRLQGKDLSLVGWNETESGLRAVIVTNRWRLDENEEPELYWADRATGTLERQERVDAEYAINNLLSPDKKHRVRVDEHELIVITTADRKERRFVFHEDDRRFVGEECIEWVSPRYLKFNGPKLALIDVTTMKMSFPESADEGQFDSYTYKFSSDFRWVLYQGEGIDGEGLFLAPVVLPGQECQ